MLNHCFCRRLFPLSPPDSPWYSIRCHPCCVGSDRQYSCFQLAFAALEEIRSSNICEEFDRHPVGQCFGGGDGVGGLPLQHYTRYEITFPLLTLHCRNNEKRILLYLFMSCCCCCCFLHSVRVVFFCLFVVVVVCLFLFCLFFSAGVIFLTGRVCAFFSNVFRVTGRKYQNKQTSYFWGFRKRKNGGVG